MEMEEGELLPGDQREPDLDLDPESLPEVLDDLEMPVDEPVSPEQVGDKDA